MTDQELLTAAAHAADMPYVWKQSARMMLGAHDSALFWNPLYDDGDTMRLVVRMHMTVLVSPDGWTDAACPMGPLCRVDHGDAPGVATRRAVVMAVAAMAEIKQP